MYNVTHHEKPKFNRALARFRSESRPYSYKHRDAHRANSDTVHHGHDLGCLFEGVEVIADNARPPQLRAGGDLLRPGLCWVEWGQNRAVRAFSHVARDFYTGVRCYQCSLAVGQYVDGIEIVGSTVIADWGRGELNGSDQVSLLRLLATYIIGDDRTYCQEVHIFEEAFLRPCEET